MATNVSVVLGANITITISESPFAVGTAGQWTGLLDISGFAGVKLTQAPIQVLATMTAPSVRVTQLPVQIVATKDPQARFSQVVIQILQKRQSEQPRISIMT